MLHSDPVLMVEFLRTTAPVAIAERANVRTYDDVADGLGPARLRELVRNLALRHLFVEPQGDLRSLAIAARHAIAVAAIAEALGAVAMTRSLDLGEWRPRDLWLAGILHGVGIEVIRQRSEPLYHAVRERARTEGVEWATALERETGARLGHLTRELLAASELPAAAVSLGPIIVMRETPEVPETVANCLHLADALAVEAGYPDGITPSGAPILRPEPERLGLKPREQALILDRAMRIVLAVERARRPV